MKKLTMFLIPLFLMLSCSVSDEDLATDDINGHDDNSLASDESDEQGAGTDDETELPDDNKVDENQTTDKEDNTPDEENTDEEQTVTLQEVQQLYSVDKIDSIDLFWKSPAMAGFEKTVIVRKTGDYPADMNDGTTVYDAIGENYSDADVEAGTEYYYRVFACYGELGCSKGIFLLGKPCFSQLDIVFVMDVSTTMKNMLGILENEIGQVWEFTDKNFNGETQFGLTVFVDDVTVTNEGKTFASADAIKAEFNKWYNFTSTNKQTQSSVANGDWPENSLDGLALTAKGFEWRDAEQTLRLVILATDDTFYESPAKFSSNIAVQHTYDETVTLLVDGKMRVGAFAAKKGGSTGTTNVEPGFFTDYNGKPSIPVATGGEVYLIDDVNAGTLHIYETVNAFIENTMCKTYDEK
ncbi:MAG TPA: hypothetical protein PK102_07595 [bacterium]|nr:hypothetical protein [bacterium]